jgi:two-component system, NtrC family, nitrogen regulation sensor histidine kinase NtrY
MERFVTSYKGFSEAPPLDRARIAVGPWLAGVARLFAGTPAAAGVALAISDAADTPAIDGDEGLLTQVLLNLLKNAGEAAAGGPDPAITLVATPSTDGRVRVVVTDTGPGIPEALARDAFLPFFTTKPTGTGIGLSLARQIVLLHGGQIGVVPGGGGRIELLLPAHDASLR